MISQLNSFPLKIQSLLVRHNVMKVLLCRDMNNLPTICYESVRSLGFLPLVYISAKTKQNIFIHTCVFVSFSHIHTKTLENDE